MDAITDIGGEVNRMRENAEVLSRQALNTIREMSGNQDVFRELLEMFISDSTERLQAMRAALEANNAQALEREAHALKGSCANFGAERLEEMCLRLQQLGSQGEIAPAREMFPSLEAELRRLHGILAEEMGSK